jgi:hypothetical protein
LFALENLDSGFLPKGHEKHLGTLSANKKRKILEKHKQKTANLGEHMAAIGQEDFLM